MTRLLSLSLAFFSLACGPAVPEADKEGCEHLKQGPQASITATAGATGAPAVKDDHKRYDVTLVDVTGGKGGRVALAADEALDFIFFLNADVPLKVFDSSDKEVVAEKTEKSSAGCAEVKSRVTVPLSVASYTLSFGPTTSASVGLVVEKLHAH